MSVPAAVRPIRRAIPRPKRVTLIDAVAVQVRADIASESREWNWHTYGSHRCKDGVWRQRIEAARGCE